MKPCPFCGEAIQVAAAKCRYCSEWIDPGRRPLWSDRQIHNVSTPDPRTFALPSPEFSPRSIESNSGLKHPQSLHATDPNRRTDITDAGGQRRVRKTTERFVPLGAKTGETYLGLPVHRDPRLHSASAIHDEHATNSPANQQRKSDSLRPIQTEPFDTRQTRVIASGIWVSAPNAGTIINPASAPTSSPPLTSAPPVTSPPPSTNVPSPPVESEARYIPSSVVPGLVQNSTRDQSQITSPEVSLNNPEATKHVDRESVKNSPSSNRARRGLPEFSNKVKRPTSAFARLSAKETETSSWFAWGLAALAAGLLLYSILWFNRSSNQETFPSSHGDLSSSHQPPQTKLPDSTTTLTTNLTRVDSTNSDESLISDKVISDKNSQVRSSGLFGAKRLPISDSPLDPRSKPVQSLTFGAEREDSPSSPVEMDLATPSITLHPPKSLSQVDSKPVPNAEISPSIKESIISQTQVDQRIAEARRLLRTGHPNRALTRLKGLPATTQTEEIRSKIESDLGNLSNALRLAQHCIELDQNYGPCWIIIAALSEKNNEFARTRKAWIRYLAISPQGKYAKLARRKIAQIDRKHRRK